MSQVIIKMVLSLQGLAFGFLAISSALGGSPTRILGFGSAALLMAASAMLLQGSVERPRPPSYLRFKVIIRDKADAETINASAESL